MRRTEPWRQTLRMAQCLARGLCAAARATTPPSTAAPPAATASRPTTTATALACAWCGFGCPIQGPGHRDLPPAVMPPAAAGGGRWAQGQGRRPSRHGALLLHQRLRVALAGRVIGCGGGPGGECGCGGLPAACLRPACGRAANRPARRPGRLRRWPRRPAPGPGCRPAGPCGRGRRFGGGCEGWSMASRLAAGDGARVGRRCQGRRRGLDWRRGLGP